jgi:hypothetical protein
VSLRDAFTTQARACAALDSPFMGQLLGILARHWPKETPLGRACAEWPGDIGPFGASLPLRIAGGLHALVLTGRDPDLKAAYPPVVSSDETLTRSVLAALARHQGFLRDWIENPPQTNEVRRSAALIPAAHWIAARHPLPFIISELGASAGLNLMWDRFAVITASHRLGPASPALTLSPDWRGPAPAPAHVAVAARHGVDMNPLDAHDPDHALRLFAYLWPDQPHRMERTRAAIAVQEAQVDRGDAIDWLETRLEQPRDGHIHLIFHTIAWQYFPAASQQRGRALIERAGAKAGKDAPLAWLAMESDGALDGAALTLRLWPGDRHIRLGRVDFHGRWIRWETI